jgi:ribose transport system permease protein
VRDEQGVHVSYQDTQSGRPPEAGSAEGNVSVPAEGESAGGTDAAVAAPTAKARSESRWRRALEFESNSVLLATLLLVAIISIVHPAFLSATALLDLLQQASFVGIMAAGMAFLIAMREIDLSVGSMFGLSVVLTALLMHAGVPPWVAAPLCIVFGAAMGLFNAVIVQVIRIPAIVATLATLSMYHGLALALTKGQQVPDMPLDSSFFSIMGSRHLGIPMAVYVLVLVTVILTIVLRLTPFGYRVRGIGSNPDAATFSGISIPRVRVQALVLMGALCGVAGVLALAFFQSGDPNFGMGLELQVIAAAVIGGTPLRGGRATVVGAVLGAILLAVVSSGLIYFRIPVNWSAFGTGAVILLAVSVDSLLRRRKQVGSSGVGL